jgi:hypothetical protein
MCTHVMARVNRLALPHAASVPGERGIGAVASLLRDASSSYRTPLGWWSL